MKICPLKVSTIALERVDRLRDASGPGRHRARGGSTVPDVEAPKQSTLRTSTFQKQHRELGILCDPERSSKASWGH